jgi:hypothetical protein
MGGMMLFLAPPARSRRYDTVLDVRDDRDEEKIAPLAKFPCWCSVHKKGRKKEKKNLRSAKRVAFKNKRTHED